MNLEQQEVWHYFVEDGRAMALNVQTGEVAKRDVTFEEIKTHHQITIGGVKYWIPIDKNKDIVEVEEHKVIFSPILADTYCRWVLEGKSLMAAAKKVGLSYYDICKFRQSHPEFDNMVRYAKKKRAELQFEKIQEIAEETSADKEEVALGKLRADIYKHIAAVGDDEYSARQKIDMDTTVGVKVVETGVRRERDVTPEEEELYRRIAQGQTRAVLKKGEE